MWCDKHGNINDGKNLIPVLQDSQFQTFGVGGDHGVRVPVCLLCLKEWYEANFPAIYDGPVGHFDLEKEEPEGPFIYLGRQGAVVPARDGRTKEEIDAQVQDERDSWPDPRDALKDAQERFEAAKKACEGRGPMPAIYDPEGDPDGAELADSYMAYQQAKEEVEKIYGTWYAGGRDIPEKEEE